MLSRGKDAPFQKRETNFETANLSETDYEKRTLHDISKVQKCNLKCYIIYLFQRLKDEVRQQAFVLCVISFVQFRQPQRQFPQRRAFHRTRPRAYANNPVAKTPSTNPYPMPSPRRLFSWSVSLVGSQWKMIIYTYESIMTCVLLIL